MRDPAVHGDTFHTASVDSRVSPEEFIHHSRSIKYLFSPLLLVPLRYLRGKMHLLVLVADVGARRVPLHARGNAEERKREAGGGWLLCIASSFAVCRAAPAARKCGVC